MIDLYTEAMAALSKLKDDYICEDDRRVVAEAKKVLYRIKSKYERERGMLFHALEDRKGERTCIVTKHGKVILGKVKEVNGGFVGFSEVEIPTRYSGGSITLSLESIAEIRKGGQNMKPYVISQDKASGAWYCHKQGYIKIPVFGSIGDKSKARAVCRMMNRDLLDIKEDKR